MPFSGLDIYLLAGAAVAFAVVGWLLVLLAGWVRSEPRAATPELLVLEDRARARRVEREPIDTPRLRARTRARADAASREPGMAAVATQSRRPECSAR